VGNRTAGVQQRLGQLSLAGMSEPDEAHVANVSGSIAHSVILPLITASRQLTARCGAVTSPVILVEKVGPLFK
jgi:hypothetical protein